MSRPESFADAKPRRAPSRTQFWWWLAAGVILGVWHASLGVKAMFVFRNDEPMSSWIWLLSGPLSTLPAVLIALLNRWSSVVWLVVGGVVSFSSLVASSTERSSSTSDLATLLQGTVVLVTGPMIALGLVLALIRLRHAHADWPAGFQRWSSRRNVQAAISVGYTVLSVGALFAADVPVLSVALDSELGFWTIPLVLGPLSWLAMARLIGLPMYLAESVAVLGLVWLAINHPEWRRAAFIGAATVWIASGASLLLMVVAFD